MKEFEIKTVKIYMYDLHSKTLIRTFQSIDSASKIMFPGNGSAYDKISGRSKLMPDGGEYRGYWWSRKHNQPEAHQVSNIFG